MKSEIQTTQNNMLEDIMKKQKQKQKFITFIIEAELDEAVEAMSKRYKTFKTAILNNAVREYIEKEAKNRT